jgi:hypothetical protein
MLIIVPNCISREIDQKLDAEIAKWPDAESSRDHLRNQLLAYFNEHGSVPDFSLEPKGKLA